MAAEAMLRRPCLDKHTPDNTWWVFDARGIELCRVCPECEDYALCKYRPEVLTDGNYEADEDIEPEDY